MLLQMGSWDRLVVGSNLEIGFRERVVTQLTISVLESLRSSTFDFGPVLI